MKTLQYWGTGNFQEHPYTGRIVTWTEKEKQTVDDAIATKLLAANAGFVLDNDESGEVVTSQVNSVTGGNNISLLVGTENKGASAYVKRSPLMTKSICGRFGKLTLAGDRTTHMQFVLAAPYDRVRIILPNLHTSTIPNVRVCVAPTNTESGATQAVGMLTPSGGHGTWVTATTMTLAASDGTTPTFTASDWLDVRSLDRADGGSLPVLLVRVEVPLASGFVTSHYSAPSGLADTANVGARTYRQSAQAVLGVTTPASMSSYGYSATTQAAIVQYVSRVSGVTVATFGDSITEGSGGVTHNFYGWAHKAADLSHSTGCPVEICNMGWGSQDSNEFYAMASLMMPLVKPSVATWAQFTPNLTLSSANIDVMRQYTAMFKQLCMDYPSTVPVYLTGLPSTYGLAQGKNWAAVDTLRLAYNTEIKAQNETVCDFASVLTGGYNATNTAQFDMLSGTTADGLHPNDTGQTILAEKFADVLSTMGVS